MRPRARGSATIRGCTRRDWVKKATRSAGRQGRRAGRRSSATRSTRSGRTGPKPSKARLVVQPDEYAGKSSAEKRHEMADWLAKEGADAAVLAALDSIAWTFNVRGADVTHTPVALALCAGQRRRHRRLVRRGREDRRRRPRSISATASACTSATSSKPHLKRAQGQDWSRSIPERSVAAIFEALDEGRRHASSPRATRRSCPRRSRTRPRSPATRRPRRATARRSSRFLHWVERGGAQGRARRDDRAGQAARLPRESSASFATCQLRHASPALGPNGAIAALQGRRRRPTAARDGHALPGRFGRPVFRTAPPTSPAPCRSASRPTEMSDRYTRVLQGPYRHRHRDVPQGHARLAARQLRPPAAVGGGLRLRPWHRPWRRRLPRGPRRAAAHFAGRQLAVAAATSRCRPA